jgi:hypothetical protein
MTMSIFGAVAMAALVVTAVFSLAGKSNKTNERRAVRKWCLIWLVGVFLLIFLPGLLVYRKTIPENANLVWYPCLYILLSIPTMNWFVNDLVAARKKDEEPVN